MTELELARQDAKLFFLNHRRPVVIDEVQYAPDFFRQVKLVADSSDARGTICLTGSQTFLLMKNVSESLAGRVGILELSGFSLRELNGIRFSAPFLPVRQYFEERRKELKKETDIWKRIFTGSMPQMQEETASWQFFYSSYVKTYIERDVRDIINIKNEGLFYKFLVALAARTGELFVPNDIASSLGISLQTVRSWTSVLETSGIIHVLHPFSNNILNRAIKTPKIYFMDTGLVCYLVGWNSSEVVKNGAMSGSIFETFIVSEIIKSYKNAGLDTRNIYFYRDRDKKEIDLLFFQNGTLYPVEIKQTASPSAKMAKSFPTLKEIPGIQNGSGCILCQCDRLMQIAEGLYTVPVEYI